MNDTLFDTTAFGPPKHTTPGELAVDFYPTPNWLCEAIVERCLPDLTADSVVLEPTAGDGAFLRAIPGFVRTAYGVEIDPVLAAEAERTSGRRVIVGDVLDVGLPEPPSHVVGNPPFSHAFVDALLDKLHASVQEGGRIALLLSVHLFQTSTTVARYADRFALQAELVPRDVYRGLERPLVLATFQKTADRRIVGIAFAREIADIKSMPAEYRAILERAKTNVWVDACAKALRRIGRAATIDEIVNEMRGKEPTRTQFARQAVRKWLRAAFEHVGPATYALPGYSAVA